MIYKTANFTFFSLFACLFLRPEAPQKWSPNVSVVSWTLKYISLIYQAREELRILCHPMHGRSNLWRPHMCCTMQSSTVSSISHLSSHCIPLSFINCGLFYLYVCIEQYVCFVLWGHSQERSVHVGFFTFDFVSTGNSK